MQTASATVTMDNTINTTDVRTMTSSSFSPSKEITVFNSIFGEPFYERTSSINTSSEVVSLSPPVTKDTYSGRGFIQGVGNVIDEGTYVSTYFLRGYVSEGNGMVFSEDGQFVTFTAKDTGFAVREGNFMYRAATIFKSNENSEELANIENQIGLIITTDGNNGTTWTKTGLWK